MIKEIKTEKFDGLAVLVPDDYAGSIANMGYLIVMVTNPATLIHEKHFNSPHAIQKQLDRVNKLPPFASLPAIKLPDGEFKILGRADHLTEEQCQTIMPLPAISARYGDPYQYSPARISFTDLLITEYDCYTGTWLILQKL